MTIDPLEGIDCDACVSECPVVAIFPDDEVPEKWDYYIELSMADQNKIQQIVDHLRNVMDPELGVNIMAAGALSLLIGNMLFITNTPVYELVVWWIAFPLLTIFGERLELNRIMKPPKKATDFFTLLIALWLITLAGIHLNRDLFWSLGSIVLIANNQKSR